MKPTDEQLMEMWADYQRRQTQQLRYPVDDASKSALGVPIGKGAGSSSTTRSQNVASTPTSFTVPVNPAGTIIIEVEGVLYEIPHL